MLTVPFGSRLCKNADLAKLRAKICYIDATSRLDAISTMGRYNRKNFCGASAILSFYTASVGSGWTARPQLTAASSSFPPRSGPAASGQIEPPGERPVLGLATALRTVANPAKADSRCISQEICTTQKFHERRLFCRRGTTFARVRFPNQVLRVRGALADSVLLHGSLGICLSLQIAEYGRIRWRLCLILISPALARCNRQTSDQNQLVFPHMALPLSHRGTVALYWEASRKGL
jgi:hypothetical protein